MPSSEPERGINLLGHVKKHGIMTMDQQRPRDNSMYFLGENSNLRSNDKTILTMLDKTKLFEHRLMTDNEKKAQKKRLRSANISRDELSIRVW